jgi:hypothetical protein
MVEHALSKEHLKKQKSKYLDRLLGQILYRTSGAHLILVRHHVSQSLIINTANVNVGLELLSCDTTVHGFVAVEVVTGLEQLLPEKGSSWEIFCKSIIEKSRGLTY